MMVRKSISMVQKNRPERIVSISLYEELKRSVFHAGYWVPLISGRTADFYEITAAIIPRFATDAEISIFANDEPISLSRAIDHELSHVLMRAGLSSERHLVTFHVLVSNKETILTCAEARSGRRVGEPYVIEPASHLAFGDAAGSENMQRTTRSTNQLHFNFSGYNDAKNILRIFRDRIATTSRVKAVLDWGIGAARVTRHLMAVNDIEVQGTDIDPINISMLHNSGYPAERFLLTEPGGSIPFPDETFDGCFGISVFTHLTEKLQEKYLSELVRIMKKGGVGIFSVHGLMHFFARINEVDTLNRWMENQGFLVLGQNTDLDEGFAKASSDNLYVNTLHSRRYIQENWRRYFSRIEILEGMTPYSHDLVVCEK